MPVFNTSKLKRIFITKDKCVIGTGSGLYYDDKTIGIAKILSSQFLDINDKISITLYEKEKSIDFRDVTIISIAVNVFSKPQNSHIMLDSVFSYGLKIVDYGPYKRKVKFI